MVFWLDCASDLSIFQKTATLEYGEFGEFSLVQGSKIQLNQLWFSIPAEHPHPKIPEVSLRVRTGLQFGFQNLTFRALRKSHVAVGISLLYLHFLCCCHRFNSSLCHSQCRHFRCPMLLFQGRVACRNLTQTGPGWQK